jgi:DMSO/TMAO reductase YedYZ molybdopterin-dependent catalytic subunit
MTTVLPPGQTAIGRFPRFGTHLHLPPPSVPANATVEIAGDIASPFAVSLAALAEMPQRELVADFHCVSGWSAVGLRWRGVPFALFHQQLIAPHLTEGVPVTHFVFAGLDGYRVEVTSEDALASDVLIATHLDGRPLEGDHGAPARLVSPSQYGYVSAKHLCRIEVHARDPQENFGHAHPLGRMFLRGPLFQRHPRGRVWHEERHRYLPGPLLRPVYRLLRPPIFWLSARRRA